MTQLILAYNFPAKHLSKLRMAAMKLGVNVRPVEKREYLQSLGSFTGALGTFESVYDGENFPELMLVLCGFSQPMVNAFLTLLNATRLPAIPLKAVLTETNQGWNSLELHDELLKEHEALKKGKPLHEQEPSEYQQNASAKPADAFFSLIFRLPHRSTQASRYRNREYRPSFRKSEPSRRLKSHTASRRSGKPNIREAPLGSPL